MNTQTQNFGSKLHELGDRIERIAEKLKADGKTAEGDELYRLGDQVKASGAEIEAPSSWVAPGADIRSTSAQKTDSKKDEVSIAQKNSSSTVNRGQASG